ncbi:MAG: MoaD/ThiS family protein [Phycisphaerae bacterium]|nr:MoaD/ThiS family protein [Phycisphaerae bacterium]
MKIKVKVFATLRKYVADESSGQQELELAEGATVGDALTELKIPEREVAFVFVNSTQKKLDEPLAEGDELGVFPPIAGG